MMLTCPPKMTVKNTIIIPPNVPTFQIQTLKETECEALPASSNHVYVLELIALKSRHSATFRGQLGDYTVSYLSATQFPTVPGFSLPMLARASQLQRCRSKQSRNMDDSSDPCETVAMAIEFLASSRTSNTIFPCEGHWQ
uniref:Uncharacterized protein n=1 Tax=Compsopogon caeruleus TaxID=31354 RepID=A0A7S1X9V7_9RHOD